MNVVTVTELRAGDRITLSTFRPGETSVLYLQDMQVADVIETRGCHVIQILDDLGRIAGTVWVRDGYEPTIWKLEGGAA